MNNTLTQMVHASMKFPAEYHKVQLERQLEEIRRLRDNLKNSSLPWYFRLWVETQLDLYAKGIQLYAVASGQQEHFKH
ncbi:MAG: hypothetical protein QG653_417 [Patescibacteria group bacterium]|nr:hypothetical protein [Patescibacteria group bacterium]